MDPKISELSTILTRLRAISIDLARYQCDELHRWIGRASSQPARHDTPGEAGLAVVARRLLKEADTREAHFPGWLSSDPVWSILLDLYVNEALCHAVSITDACVASRVPATTALRWVNDLVQSGMVVRSPDPKDRRRYHLKLSKAAFDTMSIYLASIANVEVLLGHEEPPPRVCGAVSN